MSQNTERINHLKTSKDRPRILLIESDSETRQHVSRPLAGHYAIHTTAEPQTPFSLACERSSELVLANAMMLKLDRFDFLMKY